MNVQSVKPNTSVKAVATPAKPEAKVAPVTEAKTDTKVSPISAAKAEPKAPKVEKFVRNEALFKSLTALTREELIAKAGEAVKHAAEDLGAVVAVHDRKDYTSGQDVARSGIRGAIYDFIDSRPEHKASIAEISSYMHLAQNEIYKGKYNVGYIVAKSGSTTRGMIARKQLVVVEGSPFKAKK